MNVIRNCRIFAHYVESIADRQENYASLTRDVSFSGDVPVCTIAGQVEELYGPIDIQEVIDGALYVVPTWHTCLFIEYDELKKALHFDQRDFNKKRVSRETFEVKK
jgi:hypothetical protein